MASSEPITISFTSPSGTLCLRTPQESDVDAYTETYMDPQNLLYLPMFPSSGMSRERCAGWISTCIASSGITSLVFTIVRTSDNAIVGDGGFQSIKWEDREAEIGLIVRPGMKRMGYAGETLEAIVRYGFDTLKLDRITMDTLERNVPFRSLVESKLGITGEIRPCGNPDWGMECAYVLTRSWWEERSKS